MSSQEGIKTPEATQAIKYEIVQAASEMSGGKAQPVGRAYHYEGNRYYLVRLWMFPTTRYYLVKVLNSDTHYKIFTRIRPNPKKPTEMIFQNPVGDAFLDTKSKKSIELRFDLMNQSLFMSTFPVKE